jgi:ribonuclease PH
MEVDSTTPVIQLDVLCRADGSASWTYEGTSVLAAIHGPAPVKSKHEKIDGATVQVYLENLSSPPSLIQNSLALRLQMLLERVILVTMCPRSLVAISVQPTKVSGENLFSVAFNASVVGLMVGGIPLSCVPIAFQHDGLETVFSFTSKGTVLLHQTYTGPTKTVEELDIMIEISKAQSQAIYQTIQSVFHQSYTTA